MAFHWVLIVAYLIGSIPTGVWVSKLFYKKDIREHGSKNSGLTNIFRVLGKKAAIPVAVVDLGKGSLATYLGFKVSGISLNPETTALISGLVAIAGHSFTLFAGFKGGKGVLTALGMYLVLSPLLGIISFATWVGLLWATGYVSLASIIAAVTITILSFVEMMKAGDSSSQVFFIMTALLAAFIIVRHKKNITRLIKGEENRFGKRGRNAVV